MALPFDSHRLAKALRLLASFAFPLAVLLPCVPAQAQIIFSGGVFQSYFYVAPPGPHGDDAALAIGANEFAHSGQNITCFEDNCDGLPFGGTVANFAYSAAITQKGLEWTLSGFQGSDSGDLTEAEWYLEAFFTSPDEFSVSAVNVPALAFDCSVCSRGMTQDAGVYFDGAQWVGYVTVFGQAGLRMGTQSLTQSYSVVFSRPPATVPEPRAWTMIILGFGMTGSVLRRKRLLAAASLA